MQNQKKKYYEKSDHKKSNLGFLEDISPRKQRLNIKTNLGFLAESSYNKPIISLHRIHAC
jgi:hypothetical protein